MQYANFRTLVACCLALTQSTWCVLFRVILCCEGRISANEALLVKVKPWCSIAFVLCSWEKYDRNLFPIERRSSWDENSERVSWDEISNSQQKLLMSWYNLDFKDEWNAERYREVWILRTRSWTRVGSLLSLVLPLPLWLLLWVLFIHKYVRRWIIYQSLAQGRTEYQGFCSTILI